MSSSMRLFLLVVAACLTATACGSETEERRAAPAPVSDRAEDVRPQDVDQVAAAVRTAPLRTLIGQMVMTKLDGTSLSTDERSALTGGDLTGAVLFAYNDGGAASLRAMTGAIAGARVRVGDMVAGGLVAADQEGGAARALPRLPPEQSQPSLGARGAEGQRAASRQAVAAGRALRSAGITIVLGPVADRASGPAHVMDARSFGAHPAPFVAATVRGLQTGGVSATAKHFPGLGAGTANTDDGVARVGVSRSVLMREDVAPFAAAVDARVDVVMVSHATYPGAGFDQPATVEPRLVTQLLRRRLGFTGVIVSDSMNARGLRDATRLTTPQLCPRAVAAGIDLVLLTGSLETARLCRARIADAVADGTLTREDIERAAERILRLKQRRGLLAPAR